MKQVEKKNNCRGHLFSLHHLTQHFEFYHSFTRNKRGIDLMSEHQSQNGPSLPTPVWSAYKRNRAHACQKTYIGLEHMLDLMCDWLFWPHMAAQTKEYIEKCCPYVAFKAKQPKAPLDNIMATHPLELVHLDYLCLEPGKGLGENVLVVKVHFTR